LGYRGPAPKPSALVLLEGNPGKRPINKREPQPRRVAPKCPAYLDEDAKTEWRRLVPVLRRMKVLTEADSMALSSLCQAYSTMIKAQSKLTESGLLFKTQSGYVQQSPLLSIVSSCVETITRLAREFGLTPASRTRLQMLSGAPEDQPDGILDF
jgi:P27 family predicted phage terminase small subunit